MSLISYSIKFTLLCNMSNMFLSEKDLVNFKQLESSQNSVANSIRLLYLEVAKNQYLCFTNLTQKKTIQLHMEMQPQATNSAIADAAVIADNAGQTVAPCSIPDMQNNFWLKCPTLLQTESKSCLMYL